MDRSIVYPGSIPQDTDILTPQQNAMIALGWAIQAVMGNAAGVVGLACTPSSPASMTVNVGEGALWMPSTIEATNFGSLGTDASPLMKLGINKEAAGTNFTLTAPGSAGTSINYLIEATLLEQDTSPVVLPFVNASNPAQPFSGPGNTGVAQNTARAQTVELQLKAGTAANTGAQATPATDTGYVPLYVITVNYGQSTITSTSITVAPNAPFLSTSLPSVYKNLVRQGPVGVTSSGSTTIPTGVYYFNFSDVCAGGGGGGGSYGASSGGGGGGGSPWVSGGFAVVPGDSVSWTIGANGGGGGSANPASAGSAGGVTTISHNSTVVLQVTGGTGGGPGTGAQATANGVAGSVSFVGSGVTTSIHQAAGGGLPFSVGGIAGGVGGAPGNGGYGPVAVGNSSAVQGTVSASYGGGGGGGVIGGSGGAGGTGFLSYWF